MFKYRAISFPILIALLAVMILWPEWGRYLFVVVASLAAAMMFREIGAMLRNIGVAVFEKSTVLFGGLFLFSMLSLSVARQTGSRAMTILFFLLLMFCMLAVIYAGWLLLLFGKRRRRISTGCFVPSAFSFWRELRFMRFRWFISRDRKGRLLCFML